MARTVLAMRKKSRATKKALRMRNCMKKKVAKILGIFKMKRQVLVMIWLKAVIVE